MFGQNIGDLLCSHDSEPAQPLLITRPAVQKEFSAQKQKMVSQRGCWPTQPEGFELFSVTVFVTRADHQQNHVELPVLSLDLLALSAAAEEFLNIRRQHQTVVALTSPRVRRFQMSEISCACALKEQLEPHVAYSIIEHKQSSRIPFSAHLRPGRRLNNNEDDTKSADPQTPQGLLTTLLQDQTKRITLTAVSRMTGHSCSVISLWRRGVSRRRSLAAVTQAVAEALDKLAQNNFVYNPKIHDLKGRKKNSNGCKKS